MYKLRDKFDNIGNSKWLIIIAIAFVAGILIKSDFSNGITVLFGFIAEGLGLYMLAIVAYVVMDLIGKTSSKFYAILRVALKPYLKHFIGCGPLFGPIVAFIVLAILQKLCQSFAF